MKTRIVRIGNSQGVRIPKLLLQESGLGEEVELEVQDDRIVIHPARRRRQGWSLAFKGMTEAGDDALLDPEIATEWDEEDWEW